jgi:hypothetical protein
MSFVTTCAQCGSLDIDCVESSGGVEAGDFTEEWQCGSCGATGVIKGEASDPPHEWDKTGEVFK